MQYTYVKIGAFVSALAQKIWRDNSHPLVIETLKRLLLTTQKPTPNNLQKKLAREPHYCGPDDFK
jgi:hypothetical protein